MNVRWAKGGDADIVAITIDTIALVSTTPSPPGSRIEGVSICNRSEPNAGEGSDGVRIRVKVHGCKREPDGRYRIDGRPLDLTRQLLVRLQPPV